MESFKPLLEYKKAFKGDKFYKLDISLNARKLVIPDIHGCNDTFIELLNKIKLERTNYLFLLGDYIDRGEKSKEVIDTIISLIKNNYKIFPLRGNHEQIILEKHNKNYTEEELKFSRSLKRKNKFVEKNKIKKQYLSFFSNLPYYYELNTHFLVHAGFNFSETNFLSDYNSMLWINEIKEKDINKKMIIGHKPTSLSQIQMEIKNKNKIIHLDNGCVFKSNTNFGNLLCLELDTNELFIQKNIERNHT
ncbi:MAG: serine/threonine protein phosphatase [Bacteroidales bacterium]|nr:serine/threonine protein phosphatase [Bacteroidales bacterium]